MQVLKKSEECFDKPVLRLVEGLSTGCGFSSIKFSTVRPEPRRRAPIEFSQSLSVSKDSKSVFQYPAETIRPQVFSLVQLPPRADS